MIHVVIDPTVPSPTLQPHKNSRIRNVLPKASALAPLDSQWCCAAHNAINTSKLKQKVFPNTHSLKGSVCKQWYAKRLQAEDTGKLSLLSLIMSVAVGSSSLSHTGSSNTFPLLSSSWLSPWIELIAAWVPVPPGTHLWACTHFYWARTGFVTKGRGSRNVHVQRLLGLGCFLLGTVSDHSIPLGQVQVECDERAVLQTQCPQCGTIDLQRGKGRKGYLWYWDLTLNAC